MDDVLLYPGESIDDLICRGFKIIQHKNSYRFAIDAVILANFVKAGARDTVLDLGTGSGVIPMLLAAKTSASKIVGVEIVEQIAKRAQRSVTLNNLGERVEIVCGDIKNAPNRFGRESFSVVVTNPPYMKVNEGKISPNIEVAFARHEIGTTLDDVVKTATSLLCFGGRFYMVYRTVRLADAICSLRACHLEPKIIRFVQPDPLKQPNLFLLMAKKGGRPGLKISPPLVVYDLGGNYTEEVTHMYFESSYTPNMGGKQK
jgi:tRNA1Val (adenine37-N6)-methyltransferase